MTDLESWWADWNYSLLMGKQDAYCQIRKMYQHQRVEVSWEVFQTGIDTLYTEMGYANEASKEKQLTRNYFNEEELTDMRDLFILRMNSSGGKGDQSSISAKLGAIKKKNSSMGFCMQTITMNHLKGGCFSLDMRYRSTETMVKFLADLKYLHEVLFPFILEDCPVQPDKVTFDFSVVYYSLEFMPLFFQFFDIENTLRILKNEDPKYFRRFLSMMVTHLDKDMVSGYQTRNKMHKVFWTHVVPHLDKGELKKINKYVKAERAK